VSQIPSTRARIREEIACVMIRAGFVKLMIQASGAIRSTSLAMLVSNWNGAISHGKVCRTGSLLSREPAFEGYALIADAGGHPSRTDAANPQRNNSLLLQVTQMPLQSVEGSPGR
jgi:hypothetical protein